MKALLAAIGLAFTLGLPASPVEATTSSGKDTPARTRRAKTPRPPANTGHGETHKERDQRLQRECKGKPNAGACEGYAH